MPAEQNSFADKPVKRHTNGKPTILFIAVMHSGYQTFRAADYRLKRIFDLIPHKYAFLTLAGWLRANDCDGRYVWVDYDDAFDVAGLARIEKAIAEYKPDAIGFSLCTEEMLINYKLIELLKEKHPDIPVIAGGHHVSALPAHTLEHFPLIDYVAIGEGEITLTEWLKKIAAGKGHADMSGINGLAYRDESGEIAITVPRGTMKDVNIIPDPAYDLIFKPGTSRLQESAFPLVCSYGCRFFCTFCAVEHGNYRYIEPLRAVDRIQRAQVEFGAEYFAIRDAFWPPTSEWLDIFCGEIEKRRLDIKFHFSTRVDSLSGEELTRLRRVGARAIALGVEAGHPDILKAIRKGITIDMARRAAAAVHKAGIFTVGLFMVGNQTENPDTIQATVNLAKELNTSVTFYSILAPFPGTESYNYCPDEKKDWWMTGDVRRPSICDITAEELERLSREAYIRYPLRWAYLRQHIIGGKLAPEFRQICRRLFSVHLRKYILGVSERFGPARAMIRAAKSVLKR